MERSADGETLQLMDVAVPVWNCKGLLPPKSLEAEGGPKEEVIRNETAALELQRVFRGHRARRNLADAATMAHKFGWWNVVEGAVLQHHSSSFYAYNKPQSAAQRWLRLKSKAAKVGKGLSKNEKARKLALQHWLEAIDPKHRYGHNLNFYYDVWGNSQTHEPFFYWLDIGDGKNVDLEKCKRSKLQKELIRYMSPKEREYFEVVVQNGKLVRKVTGELINTPKGDKWIFVMSTTGKLYVAKKEKGKIQHSSFLAGGATTAAGRLLVKDGTIEVMEAHSGHYHPTPENFDQLVSILRGNGADLTVAKVQCVSDDMISMKSNSTKSIGVSSDIGVSDVLVCSEDVQKDQFHNEEALIREVASVGLDPEQNVLNVEGVTVVEKPLSKDAQDKGDVVIEGLEFLQMDSSMDDSDIWEKLEGLMVEIIKPGKTSQAENQVPVEREVSTSGSDATRESSSELSPAPVSQHKLFAPALRTFSKLQDRPDICSTALHDVKTENTAEFTSDSKVYLLRRLSFNGPVVTPR